MSRPAEPRRAPASLARDQLEAALVARAAPAPAAACPASASTRPANLERVLVEMSARLARVRAGSSSIATWRNSSTPLLLLGRDRHDRGEAAAHAPWSPARPAAAAERPGVGSALRVHRRRPAGAAAARRAPAPARSPSTRGHLPSKRDIGVGARAVRIVQRDRHAVARRLAEAHVARDHGLEHDRLGEVRAVTDSQMG